MPDTLLEFKASLIDQLNEYDTGRWFHGFTRETRIHKQTQITRLREAIRRIVSVDSTNDTGRTRDGKLLYGFLCTLDGMITEEFIFEEHNTSALMNVMLRFEKLSLLELISLPDKAAFQKGYWFPIRRLFSRSGPLLASTGGDIIMSARWALLDSIKELHADIMCFQRAHVDEERERWHCCLNSLLGMMHRIYDDEEGIESQRFDPEKSSRAVEFAESQFNELNGKAWPKLWNLRELLNCQIESNTWNLSDDQVKTYRAIYNGTLPWEVGAQQLSERRKRIVEPKPGQRFNSSKLPWEVGAQRLIGSRTKIPELNPEQPAEHPPESGLSQDLTLEVFGKLDRATICKVRLVSKGAYILMAGPFVNAFWSTPFYPETDVPDRRVYLFASDHTWGITLDWASYFGNSDRCVRETQKYRFFERTIYRRMLQMRFTKMVFDIGAKYGAGLLTKEGGVFAWNAEELWGQLLPRLPSEARVTSIAITFCRLYLVTSDGDLWTCLIHNFLDVTLAAPEKLYQPIQLPTQPDSSLLTSVDCIQVTDSNANGATLQKGVYLVLRFENGKEGYLHKLDESYLELTDEGEACLRGLVEGDRRKREPRQILNMLDTGPIGERNVKRRNTVFEYVQRYDTSAYEELTCELAQTFCQI